VSASECTAVGEHINRADVIGTLIEHWNGSHWTVQPSPIPAVSILTVLVGVACPSTNNCTAVGYYANKAYVGFTLVEHWNGTDWKIQPSPNAPTGNSHSNLNAVACQSVTACTAVGFYDTSAGTGGTLIEHWNGTDWRIQPSPLPTGAIFGGLNAIACPSVTACTAIGYTDTGLLAQTWNGTRWTNQPVPTPAGGSDVQLRGLACPSVTGCTAVGGYRNSAHLGVTLIEGWNGKQCTIQHSPNGNPKPPGLLLGNFLNTVACPSVSACIAVGSYPVKAGRTVTLAERRT
jgi:hypothetical protein